MALTTNNKNSRPNRATPAVFQLCVTSPEGLIPCLAHEVRALGGYDLEVGRKAILFKVNSYEAFLYMHYGLRTASHVIWLIKQVAAEKLNQLTDQVACISWDEIVDLTYYSYRIKTIIAQRGAQFFSGPQVSKAIRLGINKYFARRHQQAPRVDLQNPDIELTGFWQQDRCWIGVKTSGSALHKRGYRVADKHPAPLKETLAAGILHLAGFNGSQLLWDPMCGSATCAIEGAFIALNKAPLIDRSVKDFGFCKLRCFDQNKLKEVCQKIRRQEKVAPLKPIYASDINPQYLVHAQAHAQQARVDSHIKFFTHDFFAEKPAWMDTGLLIMNVPYDCRIPLADLKEFYQRLGFKLKHDFGGWRAAVLVNEESPYKFISLRPQQKFSLLNGAIKTKLLIFDIFPHRADRSTAE